ncbi:acylphosphatase [Cellulomonas sp. HZM]|uniref:acylphosphatase n=1 Tax=Cellulomonas sp. HZM TaxID=1454010 RepID=UPI000493B00F|nr:acylphosphatase [Cellulomonas sp. HZM]
MGCRRVVVRGEVQGVGFRYAARREAARLGVSGWVRNRDDGAVEAVLEGDDEAVRSLVGWFRTGPAGAAVTSLEDTAAQPSGVEGFDIRA